jgi:hypothetical protein
MLFEFIGVDLDQHARGLSSTLPGEPPDQLRGGVWQTRQAAPVLRWSGEKRESLTQ